MVQFKLNHGLKQNQTPWHAVCMAYHAGGYTLHFEVCFSPTFGVISELRSHSCSCCIMAVGVNMYLRGREEKKQKQKIVFGYTANNPLAVHCFWRRAAQS